MEPSLRQISICLDEREAGRIHHTLAGLRDGDWSAQVVELKRQATVFLITSNHVGSRPLTLVSEELINTLLRS